jgi:hypothetical protein
MISHICGMNFHWKRGWGPVIVAIANMVAAATLPAADLLPPESAMARNREGHCLLILNPLEHGRDIQLGGWRMEELKALPTEEVPPLPCGAGALAITGRSTATNGKGDCPVLERPEGDLRQVGLWIHLTEDANIKDVGFHFFDAEGEALLITCPADWTGWRWVEFDLHGGTAVPAYSQEGKNGTVDAPVGGLHLAWFTRNTGEFRLAADGLLGLSDIPSGTASVDCRLSVPSAVDPGTPLAALAIVYNFTDAPAACEVSLSVQQDSQYFNAPSPDPRHGTDHTSRAKSWVEYDGKRIDDDSLTNPDAFEGHATPWINNHFTEAFQVVDLGQVREINHLVYESGDANWAWKLDVAASADGQKYLPAEGLQGIDLHGRHGRIELPMRAPLKARFLRLRYHADGEVKPIFRMGRALHVYDGLADEAMTLPAVGPVVGEVSVSVQVPPRSPAVVPLCPVQSLPTGGYFVGVRTRIGDETKIAYEHCSAFAAPEPHTPAFASRFGVNSGDMTLAPAMRGVGMGWVRFENMKWPMCSPEPGVYRFDGTVQPWVVNHDLIFKTYRDNGLDILPYLFQVPAALGTAPPEVQGGRRQCYPPKDLSLYGEFVFQTVARYGAKTHPAEALLSPDKVSGLGYWKVVELWNEPNLNDPRWGAWVGTMAQYYEMFRYGAEAARRADPGILVSNAGFAGMTFELVDTLRRHRYPDGKTPLDFCDIVNVHYYSGRVPPEIASVDTNVQRDAGAKGERFFEDDLKELVEWRDMHRPQAQLWLTETGYDTAGPKGIGERLQAARIPRVVMLQLAAGIDKVFIYREKGSNPVFYGASGLIREDNTRNPSYATVGTMIRMLDGVKPDGALRLPSPDPNVILTLWQAEDGPVLTAWTVQGASPLGLDLGECTVTDAFGAVRQVRVGTDFAFGDFPAYIAGWGEAPALERLVAETKRGAEARQAERQAMARRRALLFDFGSREHVGVFRGLGLPRWFTPVVAGDVFSKGGFGFAPGPAAKDQDTHWVSDRIERDSVRVEPGTRFAFAAPAGRFTLRVLADASVAWQLNVGGLPTPLSCACEPGRKETVVDLQLAQPTTLELGASHGISLFSLVLAEVP